MGSTQEWPKLLGPLYDAVLAPEGLPNAVNALSTWLGMDCAHFIGWDTAKFVPRLAVVDEGGIDSVSPDYVSYYAHIDPRRARMMGVPTGQVLTCQELFDERFVASSEFYQEFLLPRGRRYTMGAHLYRDDEVDFYVTFYHRLGREPFSSAQIERTKELVPHLQRTVHLLRRAESWQLAAQMGEQALDALDQGVLLLDEEGRVLRANQRAEAVLRGGCMRLHRGRLAAKGAAQPMLAEALTAVGHFGLPASLRLHEPAARDGSVQTHCLTVSRLPKVELPPSAFHSRAHLLVQISTPGAQRAVTAHQLMQMFGLTQAEARLANALARGSSVDGYAVEQGLSVPTVRTQLRAVLDKTGASRQQDLVRTLATLPSARQPQSASRSMPKRAAAGAPTPGEPPSRTASSSRKPPPVGH